MKNRSMACQDSSISRYSASSKSLTRMLKHQSLLDTTPMQLQGALRAQSCLSIWLKESERALR